MTELRTSNISELLLWLLGKRKRLRVTGNSMIPLLKPGEEILINPQAYQQSTPKIGDIVVTLHPHYPNLSIVKRVILIMDDGSCFLAGDNVVESSDSNSFGTIPVKDILGKVSCRFA